MDFNAQKAAWLLYHVSGVLGFDGSQMMGSLRDCLTTMRAHHIEVLGMCSEHSVSTQPQASVDVYMHWLDIKAYLPR